MRSDKFRAGSRKNKKAARASRKTAGVAVVTPTRASDTKDGRAMRTAQKMGSASPVARRTGTADSPLISAYSSSELSEKVSSHYLATRDHVHSRDGVCVKNRFGKECEVVTP